ncbi:hypothetical protein EDD18DRAFT_1358440 [Armillaria luteobubalina]|uniref:Uncharacterized protein n=1 Tax=Armillaria luteobubalina TaxID=153913 RepID=A0AA39PWT3_9AGAR|nr:hypothetical protein EDD18DRAFT_1358440 [Armillaria luteobubalina]
MLTEMELNITTIREHMHIEACLEELMPTLQSSLGHRFTDTNELDLVVYDLIDLSAKNNVAALFSVERHLLGHNRNGRDLQNSRDPPPSHPVLSHRDQWDT